MKRVYLKRLSIIFIFAAFLTTAALFASGNPTQTNECNQCHSIDASGVLISTNATGTVSATVGNSFILVVDASNSLGFDDRFAVSTRLGWADNSLFLNSSTEGYVQDDQTGDTNPSLNAITATFTFTPTSSGSYTIRIYAAGRTGGTRRSNYVDVSVSVTILDTTPPTLDSPTDVTYSEGQAGNTIVWNPSDANPSSYVVYKDGATVKSGPWNSSGETISVSVDGLALGSYNYTAKVTDSGSNFATDTVWVTVYDGTPPTVDSPSDVSYDEGQTGNTIVWNPSDLYPASYVIYKDGVPVKSGAWNSSAETISISVDGLSVGSYSYVLNVTDVGSNSATDTVAVIVSDGTPPSIDSPPDVPYDEGTTGHSITWNPSDLYPVSYVIYKDGVPVRSGAWNSSAESISISVDGLSVGSYSYVLNVTDIGSNTASDTVAVIVSDGTLPIIDSPIDIQYDEGMTGYSITWDPSDLNPLNYTIYRNGIPVRSGAWNSSAETISISIDGLSLGVYTYLIVVGDVGLNTVSDTVVVTVVDGTDPTIDSPVVPDIVEGTTGNLITWNPYDLNPSSYEIYRDEVLVKSGSWNSSSETISLSMDGLSLGTYNITIIVFDTSSRNALNTLFVTVYDGTPPTVDNPADIDYPEGDTGYSITWSPTDLHPVSYQILREGVQVKAGAWNSSGETMTISVDGLAIGSYNYTLVLIDVGGNIATDEVIVTVFNVDLPTINHPANQTISEGSVGLQIVWNPLDLNPSTYAIYQEGILVKSGLWNSSAETISISLDGLSLGTYNFTAIVTDQDSNTATDTVWITVIDGTLPNVDSPTDITYDEGDTGSAISWNPSDLHPVSYTIYFEGAPVKSGLWNSSAETISISVDGLIVGAYNYTLAVFDIGGNMGADTVFVYVLDGTLPSIDNPIDIEYNEGEAGGSILWNPSDSYPVSYEIYRNDVLVKSGSWNSSAETISISVTGLSVGTYNFTIIVYDIGGNSVSDIVWVTVSDATLPTIDSPVDRPINEGVVGELITWTPDDLNPTIYEIYRNDVLIRSGTWNLSSETISISLDGLSLGVHNFTLVVIDIGLNTATDTVLITVIDGTAPEIDSPSDVFYNEGETGSSITWDPTDLHPVSYEILREGVQVKTGPWNSTSDTITIDVGGLALGTYNFTVYVTDIGGNTVSDTVFVYVSDGIAPTIDSPLDVTYDEGDSGNFIVWDPVDVNPSSYEVYREGALIISGLWNLSSETVTVSVDDLQIGTYNYTIIVFDVGGSSVSDTVFVTVNDGTPPTIDSPADINYIQGATGNIITWSPTDLHPTSYEIFQDGTSVKSGAWNSSSEMISISVDGLAPGVYNYTIRVIDTGSNSVTDQVDVTIEAATPTQTTTTTGPTTSVAPPPLSETDFVISLLIGATTTMAIAIIIYEALMRKRK